MSPLTTGDCPQVLFLGLESASRLCCDLQLHPLIPDIGLVITLVHSS